jgi:hypothetical protein
MARGGARSGRPGQNYGNRSDLQNAPRLAPTAQTGQAYGQAGQQLAAQQQLPMGPPPVPLSAPSTRPSEPVQAGLSTGPGPGPESIPALAPQTGPDPDLISLAPYLPALELMSTLPTASSASRNFVRRLRGAVPPDVSR